MTNQCLYCYQPLMEGQRDFHERCSRALFGKPQPPVLPYSLANMHELAEEIIRQHVTVTGVQPKLSLDLEKTEGSLRLTLVGLWGRYILKPPGRTCLSPEWQEKSLPSIRLDCFCHISWSDG